MKQRVLILGGSYFGGKRIKEVFFQEGYEVSILNRGTNKEECNEIEQIICDRNSLEDMKQSLFGRNFDFVVDVSWQDITWVKYLCEALDFSTVKTFVFISSSAVYDVEHLSIPFKEEDALGENKYWTFYGKGKIVAEEYYRNHLVNKDTKLIILRPPYLYGPYNYAQRESFIFRQIVEHKPVKIPSSNPKLQFLHTTDLGKIVVNLCETVKEKCNIYNVGNKEYITSKDWIIECGRVVGVEPTIVECDYNLLGKKVRDFYPFFDYDNVLDATKVSNFDWMETSFHEGLKEAYEWFLANRSGIVFKESVDRNLYEMIAELSI